MVYNASVDDNNASGSKGSQDITALAEVSAGKTIQRNTNIQIQGGAGEGEAVENSSDSK